MFEVIYDDPVEVYERSYKIYYRHQYLIGVLVNVALAVGACFMVVYSSVPILGYLILAFSLLYIAASYLLYYVWPMSAMKKRRSGRTRIIVNEDEVQVIGVETEMKLKITALKTSYRFESYVYLMFNNNVFVTVDLDQLNEESKDWFINKVIV
ncbi:MAG: hypothetical protein JEZ08_21255 [Clostridiales bacterium]|nr:hypothetical protein [Clostridiales bacterium]